MALLKEAGWEIKDGKMTEVKTGKKLAFEMLQLRGGIVRHRWKRGVIMAHGRARWTG